MKIINGCFKNMETGKLVLVNNSEINHGSQNFYSYPPIHVITQNIFWLP
jgi:hypothetical protein